jgi:hypothetical protein
MRERTGRRERHSIVPIDGRAVRTALLGQVHADARDAGVALEPERARVAAPSAAASASNFFIANRYDPAAISSPVVAWASVPE